MSRRFLAAVSAVSLLATLSTVAHAEPSPVTGVELNTTVAGSKAVAAQYDVAGASRDGLVSLKKLREKMWKLNPPLRVRVVLPGATREENEAAFASLPTDSRLRDVAKLYGITTLEQYLDVSMDNEYTWIAVQRAVENDAFETIEHTRPDGSSPGTAMGDRAWDESLGLAPIDVPMEFMVMGLWGGDEEYNLLLGSKGELHYTDTATNGHLIMMIDPRNTHYGFAKVRTVGDRYYFSAWASSAPGEDAPELPEGLVSTWLYRAVTQGEKPTGLKKGAPVFDEGASPSSSPKPKPAPTSTPAPTPAPSSASATPGKPAPKPVQPSTPAPKPSPTPAQPSKPAHKPAPKPDPRHRDTAGTRQQAGGAQGSGALGIIAILVAIAGILGALAHVGGLLPRP